MQPITENKKTELELLPDKRGNDYGSGEGSKR